MVYYVTKTYVNFLDNQQMLTQFPFFPVFFSLAIMIFDPLIKAEKRVII